MKQLIPLLLVASLVVFVGCSSTNPPDTQAMLGMRLNACVKQYDLDKHKTWATPNLPRGTDDVITYFLPDGNLIIDFDDQEKITSATFYASDKSADERLKEVHGGWHKWVEAHTVKKQSNGNDSK